MTVGEEVITVAADKSASAISKRYSFGTVWDLGQKVALAWSDKASNIEFIPFSASFSVYPKLDKQGIFDAAARECTGQSTRLASVLRYSFNEHVMWSLSGRKDPVRLVVVCDGEPDDLEQSEIEVKRFVTGLPSSSPYYLEIITQKPWESMETLFREHSKPDGFSGFFNTIMFPPVLSHPVKGAP